MKKYPWISYQIDLQKLGYNIWLTLGECVSKFRHISQIPLLPEVQKRLHIVYMAKGVHATTAIEGNTLSEEQVIQIIEGKGQVEESKKYLQQEVQNILDACNSIVEALGKGNYSSISTELLCELNGQVLAGGVPFAEGAEPGKLRKHRVGVGSYMAPDAPDVSQLLNDFCGWINELPKPSQLDSTAFAILKAITAHLYIAWIHPFGDGNGRTARLVEFMILLGSGVPSPAAHLLSNHYNATRAEYYRQLDRSSKTGGDVREFFSYAIQGLHDGLGGVIDFIVGQVQAISWEHYIYDYFGNLPSKEGYKRQRNVMIQFSRQAQTGGLTRQQFEEVTAKIYLDARKTKNTFTRDLNALLKMGFIRDVDGKFVPNIDLILRHLPFSM